VLTFLVQDIAAPPDPAAPDEAFATPYTMTILGGAASLIIATRMGVLITRCIAVPITRMAKRHDNARQRRYHR